MTTRVAAVDPSKSHNLIDHRHQRKQTTPYTTPFTFTFKQAELTFTDREQLGGRRPVDGDVRAVGGDDGARLELDGGAVDGGRAGEQQRSDDVDERLASRTLDRQHVVLVTVAHQHQRKPHLVCTCTR